MKYLSRSQATDSKSFPDVAFEAAPQTKIDRFIEIKINSRDKKLWKLVHSTNSIRVRRRLTRDLRATTLAMGWELDEIHFFLFCFASSKSNFDLIRCVRSLLHRYRGATFSSRHLSTMNDSCASVPVLNFNLYIIYIFNSSCFSRPTKMLDEPKRKQKKNRN